MSKRREIEISGHVARLFPPRKISCTRCLFSLLSLSLSFSSVSSSERRDSSRRHRSVPRAAIRIHRRETRKDRRICLSNPAGRVFRVLADILSLSLSLSLCLVLSACLLASGELRRLALAESNSAFRCVQVPFRKRAEEMDVVTLSKHS